MLPKTLISLAILLQCLSLKAQDNFPPVLPPTAEFLQIQEYKKKIDSLSEIIFKRTLDTIVPTDQRYLAVREAALIQTDKSISFLLDHASYCCLPLQEAYKEASTIVAANSIKIFFYASADADGWHVLSRVLNLMRQKTIDDRMLSKYLVIIDIAITARRYKELPSLKPIFEMELAMTSPYDRDPAIKIYRENLLRMIALCR